MDSPQRSLPAKQILVELDRRGDRLSRRYRVADGAWWEGPGCGNVRKLAVARRDNKSKVDLALLCRVIASGAESERTAHLTGDGLDAAGELLFQILFGTLDDWEGVALRLLGDAKLRPSRAPVRLRIHTEDGELLGPPWRITTWDQKLLLGERWTFELTNHTVDGDDLLFAPPGRILVIAPEAPNGPGEDDLLTEAHVAALRGIVDRVRPGHRDKTDTFQKVSTWRDLDAALSTRPEIVYFYGHGRANGGQVYLRFGAGEGEVSIRDFIARLRPAAPKVVFLNACSLGQGGRGSVGHQLGATVPLVVSHLTPARADVARELAVDWFTEVLRNGSDPIAAAHRRAGSGRLLCQHSLPPRARARTQETRRMPPSDHDGPGRGLTLGQEHQVVAPGQLSNRLLDKVRLGPCLREGAHVHEVRAREPLMAGNAARRSAATLSTMPAPAVTLLPLQDVAPESPVESEQLSV